MTRDAIASWKRVHMVGIKGVAMAAMAVFFAQKGMKVTGSDVPDEFPTDAELKAAHILVFDGFDPNHVLQKKLPDAVIYTGAHNGRDNPEVAAAIAKSIPVFPHGQALGMVMDAYRQVAVGGSHGKTTTSAMIAAILSSSGAQPSYAIGCGSIGGLGPAGKFGKGSWFVAEADEYVTDPGHDQTPRFLWMKPEILVVTNIDFDHPDAYADLSSVQDAFVRLQNQQVGQQLTIVNIDDPKSVPLLSGKHVITYGFSPRADVRISHVGDGAERTFFTLEQRGTKLGEFTLKVPGIHNVANATAAIIASQSAGVSLELVKAGLLTFVGTKRRFEKVGIARGAVIYDDYAHHPAEIEATIAGAKRWYPDARILAVFQPHTYSRTKALMEQFSKAFDQAAVTIIADIYASARESDTLGISAETLVEHIAKRGRDVYSGKDLEKVITLLEKIVRSGDVVLFMGAGDIALWGKHAVQTLGKNIL